MKYFLQASVFNWKTPDEFGLEKSGENLYINNKDQSRWILRELFDFDRGNRFGFCRIPLPSFQQLIDFATLETQGDNFYGAIAVLLADYPNEFLEEAEKRIVNNDKKIMNYKHLFTSVRSQMLLDENVLVRTDEKSKVPYYRRWKKIFEKLDIL